MRKTILKITLGGALAVTAAMGVQMASSNKTMSNILMQNVEALADGENNGGSSCPIYEISKTNEIIVLNHAKNRWLGLVPGCKNVCNMTCTIKNAEIEL